MQGRIRGGGGSRVVLGWIDCVGICERTATTNVGDKARHTQAGLANAILGISRTQKTLKGSEESLPA